MDPQHKVYSALAVFVILLAGTISVALSATAADQSHPISEIVANDNLDMNGYRITNLGGAVITSHVEMDCCYHIRWNDDSGNTVGQITSSTDRISVFAGPHGSTGTLALRGAMTKVGSVGGETRIQSDKIRFQGDITLWGPDRTFDMDNNDIINVGKCGGCDIAEVINTSQSLENGEIVSISQRNDNEVAASDGAYDTDVVGAVSTNPVIRMGGGGGGVDMGADRRNLTTDSGEVPVALAGVVPVKVSTQNGPIDRGDPIVASSVPGVGMKGDVEDPRFSSLAVIGKAMEDLEEGEGKINVLVR